MNVLDCDSADSIYLSLERILGLRRRDLDGFFERTNLEAQSQRLGGYCAPGTALFEALQEEAGVDGHYEQTYWFHLSRTLPGTCFEDGILPLAQCIDPVWEMLYSFAAKRTSCARWKTFRSNIGASQPARLYRMKMSDPLHWGPFGMLVKGHAFIPNRVGNHDYLGGPEIVEDICRCFEKQFGYDLLRMYRRATVPVIVKFIGPPEPDCVQIALYHLYNRYHCFECSMHCSTNYSSQGMPISRDRIVAVEILPSKVEPARE